MDFSKMTWILDRDNPRVVVDTVDMRMPLGTGPVIADCSVSGYSDDIQKDHAHLIQFAPKLFEILDKLFSTKADYGVWINSDEAFEIQKLLNRIKERGGK